MKTRLWELVVGSLSLLWAVDFAVAGAWVRFAITVTVLLWIARRVLPRYAIAFLFARRALRRWRLGPKAVLATIVLGVKMNRLFTPMLAANGLRHSRARRGWGYRLFVPIVAEAAAAHGVLRRLSFYETSDTLALAEPLRSLRDLGAQLDRIDGSLVRSTGGAFEGELQVALGAVGSQGSYSAAAEALQSSLERTLAKRSGVDGDWFRRVIAKRREVLNALLEGDATMRRIRQKAVWMLERQHERGSNDEVELIDVSAARGELREAAQLVSALAEGVGEVHLGPPARL